MNYDELIEYMITNKNLNYSNLALTSIEKDLDFEVNDTKLRKSIKDAKTQGAYINYMNQDSTIDNPDMKSDFCHVCVNMPLNSKNIKVRLYMAPTQKNLHQIIIELINLSLSTGKTIKFKYALNPNRFDQLVIYLKNQEDINEKIEMLKTIRNKRPELFKGTKKCASWIFQTEIDSVYLAPEPQLRDFLDRQTSYSSAFIKALSDTREIMKYIFDVEENQDLFQYSKSTTFKSYFKLIFEEMLTRYGIFMKKNNQTGQNEIASRAVKQIYFKYNKEKKELCESRIIDDVDKEYIFTSSQKDIFLEYFLPDTKKTTNNRKRQ